jgi:long-chain acyl-CoA synthetase
VTDFGVWSIAERSPEATAVVDPDGARTTFGELSTTSNRISNALRQQGFRAGDRVAIMARNRADVLATILGVSQIGGYYALINTHT